MKKATHIHAIGSYCAICKGIPTFDGRLQSVAEKKNDPIKFRDLCSSKMVTKFRVGIGDRVAIAIQTVETLEDESEFVTYDIVIEANQKERTTVIREIEKLVK